MSNGYLRVLVVDDEQPAVDEISWLLRQQGDVLELHTAANATAALRLLDEHTIDVVFLDIEMPDLSGLELARVLRRFASPPAVVFVTAFERHAVDAFEVKAVDYVLKPIRTDRLDDTMRRIVALIPRAVVEVTDAPALAPSGSVVGGPRSRLAVESAGRTSFVDRVDVVAVEAARDYVRLHTALNSPRSGLPVGTDALGGLEAERRLGPTALRSYLVRIPISELESEWSTVGFVRVHRSYLVAVSHVRELLSEGQGLTVLVGSLTIPVSRTYSRNLRERLVSDRSLPSSPTPGFVSAVAPNPS